MSVAIFCADVALTLSVLVEVYVRADMIDNGQSQMMTSLGISNLVQGQANKNVYCNALKT